MVPGLELCQRDAVTCFEVAQLFFDGQGTDPAAADRRSVPRSSQLTAEEILADCDSAQHQRRYASFRGAGLKLHQRDAAACCDVAQFRILRMPVSLFRGQGRDPAAGHRRRCTRSSELTDCHHDGVTSWASRGLPPSRRDMVGFETPALLPSQLGSLAHSVPTTQSPGVLLGGAGAIPGARFATLMLHQRRATAIVESAHAVALFPGMNRLSMAAAREPVQAAEKNAAPRRQRSRCEYAMCHSSKSTATAARGGGLLVASHGCFVVINDV
ncbi:hypothetical protein MTO96_006103 [Rhipicephalus appendiculatus]